MILHNISLLKSCTVCFHDSRRAAPENKVTFHDTIIHETITKNHFYLRLEKARFTVIHLVCVNKCGINQSPLNILHLKHAPQSGDLEHEYHVYEQHRNV